MRLLVLSFYFPPDLSAGSFRVKALVEALRERAPPDAQIDVVTTAPNRYRTFTHEASGLERQPGFAIRRVALPRHRNDMRGQARAFAAFARAVLRHTRGLHYDLVFATSSRLMTAALGGVVASRAGARLYLDLRDIFVDTISDVLPVPWAWPVRVLFDRVERWTVRRAASVNLVSRGFEGYFQRRYPGRAFNFVTNGIDEEFVATASSVAAAPEAAPSVVQIVYAGNIGDGQALHKILPDLARRLNGRARFVVVGDGSRRAALELALAGLDNVELRLPMARSQLLDVYRSADVLFLHLDALPAFEKVLPSKLFEYAALGKPILAGVSGHAADFVRAEIDNAAVFAPTDVAAAVRAFDALALRTAPRPAFVAKFARQRLSRELADDILRVVAPT
jgi:glycosyltransferase involved in cell wall biosynthesis